MSTKTKAEEKFAAIMEAAKGLYEAVCDVRKSEAKHVLRRLEQVAYESHEGEDDDEFSAAVCLNELDIIDAARQRLSADHDLPFNGDDLTFRWSVARVLAKRGVKIDPTFANLERHEWNRSKAILKTRSGKARTVDIY
jgi:hypothetical protein